VQHQAYISLRTSILAAAPEGSPSQCNHWKKPFVQSTVMARFRSCGSAPTWSYRRAAPRINRHGLRTRKREPHFSFLRPELSLLGLAESLFTTAAKDDLCIQFRPRVAQNGQRVGNISGFRASMIDCPNIGEELGTRSGVILYASGESADPSCYR